MTATECRSSSRRRFSFEPFLHVAQEPYLPMSIREHQECPPQPTFRGQKRRQNSGIRGCLRAQQPPSFAVLPWIRSCLLSPHGLVRTEVFKRDSCSLLLGLLLR